MASAISTGSSGSCTARPTRLCSQWPGWPSLSRGEAFQEVDFQAMFAPLAKWAARIDDARRIPEVAVPQQGIVKGDAKSLSIAAASVIAKTTRDAMMVEAEARWPGYGFARHKGYGAPEHLEALRPVERLVNLPEPLDGEELAGGEGGLAFLDARHLVHGGEGVALMAAFLVEQHGLGELDLALSAERDLYGNRHAVTSRVAQSSWVSSTMRLHVPSALLKVVSESGLSRFTSRA